MYLITSFSSSSIVIQHIRFWLQINIYNNQLNQEKGKEDLQLDQRVLLLQEESNIYTPKQFQKFLSNPDNKIDLVKFLKNDWTNNKDHILQLVQEKSIFVTCEDKGYCVTISHVPELSSMYEEA